MRTYLWLILIFGIAGIVAYEVVTTHTDAENVLSETHEFAQNKLPGLTDRTIDHITNPSPVMVLLYIVGGGILLYVMGSIRQKRLKEASSAPSTDTIPGVFAQKYSAREQRDPPHGYIPFILLTFLGLYFLWDVGWFDGRAFVVVVVLSLVGILYPPTREMAIGLLTLTAAALIVIGLTMWTFGWYEPTMW